MQKQNIEVRFCEGQLIEWKQEILRLSVIAGGTCQSIRRRWRDDGSDRRQDREEHNTIRRWEHGKQREGSISVWFDFFALKPNQTDTKTRPLLRICSIVHCPCPSTKTYNLPKTKHSKLKDWDIVFWFWHSLVQGRLRILIHAKIQHTRGSLNVRSCRDKFQT